MVSTSGHSVMLAVVLKLIGIDAGVHFHHCRGFQKHHDLLIVAPHILVFTEQRLHFPAWILPQLELQLVQK